MPPPYRIGTASRLSGLPIATLRNWEQRYGIVVAARSTSGQRRYSLDDIEHLRTLKSSLDAGLTAGEAHASLVRLLREEAADPRLQVSAAPREAARHVRSEVAASHARTAAEQERAARRLHALAERTAGATGERFRELARLADERASRTKTLAEEALRRSAGATVHELRPRVG